MRSNHFIYVNIIHGSKPVGPVRVLSTMCHLLLWEIYQAGQERLPGKAKLPGTCLFVDDKNHRERGRAEERGNPSGTLEMDGLGDVLCYSHFWMLLNLLPSLDSQNFWKSVTIMPWYPTSTVSALLLHTVSPNSPKQG